ncbi:MAG TPA: galactose-1-phosphate uridylyltransferase, partial [Actinomycetota bacterium]|nr:galactose-1-phosphate uridylyltransferase [Actinomycetota bacterium]
VSHVVALADMSVDRVGRLVDVWSDRYAILGERDDVRYVLIFENRGIEMGVTLHHPHGQIYGFTDVPPRALAELRTARAHFERTERCVHCDVVGFERGEGVRVVADNPSFFAFVPFAARFPYEVHISARRHATSLLDLTDPERRALAEVLRSVLRGYDRLFGFPMPYVMVMHQSPTDDGRSLSFSHLHIELMPPYRTAEKLKYIAGSELGAGAFMNDTAPEETAAQLRAAVASAG